ncbi:MAG: hypothetical protein QXU18_14175, partial [Thermoplasmatales archaeon]
IYGYEDWIYSNSSNFKWTHSKLDLPRIPFFYRKILWDTPYFIHLNHIVDEEKYFKKLTTVMWQKEQVREKYGSFENFLHSIKESNYFYDNETRYIAYDDSLGKLPSFLDRFVGLNREEIIKLKKNEIENKIMPY